MIQMSEGIFYLNGKPKFLLSADYPYYRDLKENWSNRLDQLKAAHIDTISFYVPWRHHYVEGKYDFNGHTYPNRDVKEFIRLCQQKKLYILLKPGPFIHAEVDYGGLPDLVCPDFNPEIEAMLDSNENKRYWHNALPSPLDPVFDDMVRAWFEAVDDELIRDHTYPRGPIIALQILNEGIYSDGQHPITDYDYSQASKRLFHQFLWEKYQSIENYNNTHISEFKLFEEIQPPTNLNQLKSIQDWLQYIDWADYASYYMAYLYDKWGGYIKTDLPYILNLNPPHDREQGYDDWLTRYSIERFTNQHYGYTNWIGVVSHDMSAFNRYLLLSKRGRGPNLEENWGFSKLYDTRYKYTAIPFFQTIMVIACGATGFNIYTGVSTEHWNEQIDSKQEQPYPDCSPINEKGERTKKYDSLKLLNQFLHDFGDELLECQSSQITWGLYEGYNQWGSWGANDSILQKGIKPVPVGKSLEIFQSVVRKHNIDFNIRNIEKANIAVENHPLLVMMSGFYMSLQTQNKLLDYVQEGGFLFLTNELPYLDEQMKPCTLLKSKLFIEQNRKDNLYFYGKGRAVFISDNVFMNEKNSTSFIEFLKEHIPSYLSIQSDAQIWLHKHPTKDIEYLFILGLENQEYAYSVKYEKKKIRILLPQKSSAILRLVNGQIHAAVVKGIHELENSYTAPMIKQDDLLIYANKPCDLYFNLSKEHSQYETAPAGEKVVVTIQNLDKVIKTLN